MAELGAAIAAYEATMFARSVSKTADAHRLLRLCLDDRALSGFIAFFASARLRAGPLDRHHDADWWIANRLWPQPGRSRNSPSMAVSRPSRS